VNGLLEVLKPLFFREGFLMFHSMSRTAFVAVIALTLVLLSVPAVHARPIDRSGPSIEAGGWVDAALSWLNSLLFGDQPASQEPSHSAFDAVVDDYYHLNSGSCIDPEGRPRCGV
jgi:hypothetical protein